MAKARFNLRNSNGKAPQPIYLYFRFQNTRLVYGTGVSVKPKYWDSKSQRVRNSTEVPERHEINDYLNDLATAVERIYLEKLRAKEPITREAMKQALHVYTGRIKPPEKETLFGYIERFIEQGGNGKKPRTLQRYRTTLNFLQAFAKAKRLNLDFETIDQEVYDSFVDYLATEHNQAVNTIGVYVKNLKVFLREAYDEGITDLRTFEKKWFKVPNEEADHIYLTEEEIEQLYQLDLSESPRLERVRDLFVIGCWTGCRFSDLEQVKPENIDGQFIQMKQQKTGKRVAIPIHHTVQEIIEKYEGELPAPISNQKMNDYLKEIGKLAGLTVQTVKTITKGGEGKTSYKPKYQLITTHTARRSFATNQYKREIPTQTIMAITGHTTESNFLKYLKLSPEDHAKILDVHWRQERPIRKVVK